MLEDRHPDYPFVALLVSGGHTQLVRVDGIGVYRLLGESLRQLYRRWWYPALVAVFGDDGGIDTTTDIELGRQAHETW